jgi:uncharacterized OB-fold protein
MIDEDTRPVPQPSALARPFWEHIRAHEIAIQHCARCARYMHPPLPFCPACRGTALAWKVVPGTGTVYSFAIVHRAPLRVFRAKVPYAIALVTLDVADVNVLANVRDGIANIAIGQRVRTAYEDVAPGVTLFEFVPAESAT